MNQRVSRREVLTGLAAAALTALPRPSSAQTAKSAGHLEVHKDPQCGCCSLWVDHMKANGFTAAVRDGDVAPIKAKHKITPALSSCHTTLIGGYVIEGHVPASDVKRLLAEKPKGIVGLTIPGMPQSAPGMDMKPFQPYTVLSFDAQGKTAVYAKHDKA
ncbi:MAG TPA: DUF411 domain-containing protein [Vicinamibacterales bacterium]|nr:DUF411 domain-containing protein [Vicinamibacterales bacterium]